MLRRRCVHRVRSLVFGVSIEKDRDMRDLATFSERVGPRWFHGPVARYSLAVLAAAIAFGVGRMLHAATQAPLGRSTVYVLAVCFVAWFLSTGPSILTATLPVLSQCVIFPPHSPGAQETAEGVAIRLAVLIAVGVAVGWLRRRTAVDRLALERDQAQATHLAARATQAEHDRKTQLTSVSLELRTLAGVIQLAAEGARTAHDGSSRVAQAEMLDEAAERLSLLANRVGAAE
jgi:signal transduction histidine kinase